MNKKAIIVLVISLLIVATVVTVTLFSCGAFSTPKMQVYNYVAQNEVVKTSKEQQAKYNQIYNEHNTTANARELDYVNDVFAVTTSVIEELLPYTLFVKNTDVSDKKIVKAYEEYVSAKAFADKKLNEALATGAGADWEAMLKVLATRYSSQAVKYNAFAQELFNYVNKACFASNPKNLKFTTLTFIQGFNNYLINNIVAQNKMHSATLSGIGAAQNLVNYFTTLKTYPNELLTDGSVGFINSFGKIENKTGFYEAYSKSLADLRLYIETDTNFNATTIDVQRKACWDVFNFLKDAG